MNVTRIRGYQHLESQDFEVPQGRQIFFDPADTEVGVYVGTDLLGQLSTVLDLGCGSGAAAAAFVRAGASRVHGIDLSQESIEWACEHYNDERYRNKLSFSLGDFLTGTPSLLQAWPLPSPPTLVTSNPAYVPLPASLGASKPSIYGGTDGLRFVPAVIGHARAIGADVALTIGSYSCPEEAAGVMLQNGYSIKSLTLCALPLGSFTLAHPEQILELERQGRAILLRAMGELSYLIVGLAGVFEKAVRPKSPTAAQIRRIISSAAQSKTAALEGIKDADREGGLDELQIRILEFPLPPARQHF